MPSTNKTPNLGLNLYTANDYPKYLTDHNNDMTKIDSKTTLNEFTDSNGAKNYIGLNIGTIAVSTGTHIFTNCTGTITVSGNTAKVHAVNSPSLTINGKTNSNWRNIGINGATEFTSTIKTIISLDADYTTILEDIQGGDCFVINAFIKNIGFVQFTYNYSILNSPVGLPTASYLIADAAGGIGRITIKTIGGNLKVGMFKNNNLSETASTLTIENIAVRRFE